MEHALGVSTVRSSTNSKRVCPSNTPIQSSSGVHRIITPDNYSSLERLLAVTAYVQWFIANLKQCKPLKPTGPLNPAELNTARLKWLRACQELAFTSEISALKSQHGTKRSNKASILVRQLRLFLNRDRFIGYGGRIHNAPLSDIVRFPCLLPQKHTFTKLLIYSLYNSLFHGGVNSTLTALRQQYWIPSGRQYIKGLLRYCNICKRHNGKPYAAPEQAPLHKDRL